MNDYNLHRFNESSLLVEIPGGSLLEANAEIHALYAHLKLGADHLLRDAMPGSRSLLVVCKNPGCVEEVENLIGSYSEVNHSVSHALTGETISVPVCYDPQLGNDLPVMSELHNLSSEEIISLHQSITYHVFMLGFLPGFPYMGEVDERITTPRKAKPVPTKSGAVGIAGRQTGIYPLDSPGGWHIVGYTPVKMFDSSKETPAFLQPGNLVKFESISLDEYLQWDETENKKAKA